MHNFIYDTLATVLAVTVALNAGLLLEILKDTAEQRTRQD